MLVKSACENAYEIVMPFKFTEICEFYENAKLQNTKINVLFVNFLENSHKNSRFFKKITKSVNFCEFLEKFCKKFTQMLSQFPPRTPQR